MSKRDVRMGDVGTVFRIKMMDNDTDDVANVSTATIRTMKFHKPNTGTVSSKPAVFTTDGIDGNIEYVGEDGFIDEAGTWKIQAYVELPSGKWHTSTGEFTVVENL